MQLVVKNFDLTFFDNIGSGRINNLQDFQHPGFEKSYLIQMQNIKQEGMNIFLGLTADRTMTIQFQHQLSDSPVTNPFQMNALLPNVTSPQSFTYSNGVAGNRAIELLELIPDLNAEQKAGANRFSNQFISTESTVSYRQQTPEGLLWTTKLPSSSQSNGAVFLASPGITIIPLLAAIAVPNFLEAQVRAKVSRVRADSRSAATALEAYYIDNNQYPANPAYDGDNSWLTAVTQPIAYITSDAIMDPFMGNASSLRYYQFTDQQSEYPDLPRYIIYSAGPDEDYDLGIDNGTLLQMRSKDDFKKFEYDPQNGTVSNGDIIRFSY